MSQKKTAVTLILSGLLSACGAVTELPVVNTPINSDTTINSLSVVGTSSTSNNVVPVNAGVNNGEFTVAWNVSSSDPYHVDVYLSEDDILDFDVPIFSQNCGSISQIYNCSTTALFDCRLTSENKMSCGTVSAANTEKNLTTFLDVLPKQVYLIIEACNALLDNCKTASVAIELQ